MIFKHSCGFLIWCEGGDLNPQGPPGGNIYESSESPP
nr:MAG TPA: hypothetical protein [Caudoviricetes sp.]